MRDVMKKKYAMTLLEIMIVIFIIGIIGSVVGYNMRGSLDQGKAFKTKEATRKIYEVLALENARGKTIPEGTVDFLTEVSKILKESGFIRKASLVTTDGWGHPFYFFLDDQSKELRFTSEKYESYCARKGIETEYPWEEDKELDSSH